MYAKTIKWGAGVSVLGVTTFLAQQALWRRDATKLASYHERFLAVAREEEVRKVLQEKGIPLSATIAGELNAEDTFFAWKRHELHRRVLFAVISGGTILLGSEMKPADSASQAAITPAVHMHRDLKPWLKAKTPQTRFLLHTPVAWLVFHNGIRAFDRAITALEATRGKVTAQSQE